MKKKKLINIRRGQILKCANNMVLVTGTGDKKEAGYDCFSGVVVYSNKVSDDFVYPVGKYSKTWNKNAFTHTRLRMNQIMHILVK